MDGASYMDGGINKFGMERNGTERNSEGELLHVRIHATSAPAAGSFSYLLPGKIKLKLVASRTWRK